MIQIEKTNDGSNTLFVPELNEHYHSIKGALTESEHIFIRMGLEHCAKTDISLLEIGFGTGLNAFLTLLKAEETGRHVNYTTIEKFPLDEDIIRNLHYPELAAPEQADYFYEIHRAAWNTPQAVSPFFILHKIEGDFTDYRFEGKYDLIYFDAFAPEKQPEMWSQELFDYLYSLMNPGGILTTYCAKGAVRRMMQTSGFIIERLPGPPGGKREILRGTRSH